MSINEKNTADQFCKFINHGLVYNKNTEGLVISPCCYFSKNDYLDIEQDINRQIEQRRQAWSKEDWNQTCKICLDLEKSGQHSYRQSSYDVIQDDVDGVAFLTVAVNKQCNLACASCGPGSSSFWYQQNLRDRIQQPSKIINLHREDRLEKDTKKFLSIFKDRAFKDLRYIKFGGGEPLMSSTHADILETINDPSLVTIQYTSNFSIEPSTRIYDLWSKFKLVKWCASLDGVEDQFELLRWPYRWHDLEDFVSRVRNQVPHNVIFGVEHTLNPLNVWYIDRFRAWFRETLATNRYGDPSDFNLHLCIGDMSFDQTPPDLREKIRSKYGPHDPVVRLLDLTPYTGSYSNLLSWADYLDSRRQTNWRHTFAEISSFFLGNHL